MISTGAAREAVNARWRPLVTPAPLIRPDRVRPIDRIIDYFGGTDGRTASAARLRARPVRWREEQQTEAVRV